ncbi:MAG: hypothetical protein R3F61_19735 [Myxococcota bacterium]
MILLVLPALASSFEPVVTDLGGGARIDWTELRLEVQASHARSGSEGTKAVEELARRTVEDGMGPAADRIPIAPGDLFVTLRDSPELWPAVAPRIGRWMAIENRYHSSGRVTITGALPLVELLKPVSLAMASSRTGPEAEVSGIVLDARGLKVEPCFAPEVRGPGGEVLYDGRMWVETAVEVAPAVWVSDAAHPAADRAGSSAFVSRVASAEGCVLTVPVEAARTLGVIGETRLIGEGRVVIVVDP